MDFVCERCGKDLPRIDVTTFGDRRPRYVPGACDCPVPSCPFCEHALDDHGKCTGLDCFMLGLPIPIPELL